MSALVLILLACATSSMPKGQMAPVHVSPLQTGTAISSDRRFTATASLGEAEVMHLAIRQGKHLVMDVTDVHGFAWSKTKPETLIYGTSGLYGQGGLWTWDPIRGINAVVKAKSSVDEAFILERVDLVHGKPVVFYRHGGAEEQVTKLQRERLQQKALVQ